MDQISLLVTSELEGMNLSGFKDSEILHLLFLAVMRQSVRIFFIRFYFVNFISSFYLYVCIFIFYQPLQILELKHCKIPHHIFEDLLPGFSELVQLDVSGSLDSSINDQFLLILGQHCSYLE